MIAPLLLATAEQASKFPKMEVIFARGFQILCSTIFSIIIVWVVIKIWNGDWWAGDDDKKQDDKK